MTFENEARRLLPPMGALASFVAAARHGSFSRAAEQMGLTQSAVSRQIALLEDWLQVRLFDRHGRRVQLNAAGRAYAEQIRPALDRIRQATRQASSRSSGNELNIAALPGFAMRWLAPRLPQFSAAHPELVVNIAARSFPFNLVEEGFDAAVHFGQPDWPGADHTYLFGDVSIPVCSPAWLAAHPMREPADLLDKPLLFQTSRRDAWRRFFAEHGIDAPEPLSGPVYDQFLILAQAAAAGAGVALVPEFLIESELQRGELVRPFDLMLVHPDAYYLVIPNGFAADTPVAKFAKWMAGQDPLRTGGG